MGDYLPMPDYSETSRRIKEIRSKAKPRQATVELAPRPKRDLSFISKLTGVKKEAPKPKLSVYGPFSPRPKLEPVYESAEQIAEKLNTLIGAIDPAVINGFVTIDDIIEALKNRKDVFDISVIRNGEFLSRAAQRKPIDNTDERYHGGGDVVTAGTNVTITINSNGQKVISASSGTSTSFETPVGTINDTNVTFTVTHTPIYIVQNGFQYFDGAGYTIAGLTVTLSTPVGTGGFIRSAYTS